ncbi:chemotaxis-specific protein-glutamate methyltransferase CheB [Parapontixanthobacter aurantiacus]|nr:chemotaxis-specific protein-glutamate methyltransferase CheB [Parapontixanthobacter aurantiacus]
MNAHARLETDRTDATPAIRVMVVDDSLTIRTIFSRIVNADPRLTVVGDAGTAEKALMKLKMAPVDVIMLDLEMPGMGGLEALPKMLEACPEAQILVISALTDEGAEHTISALSMGAADTMLKPMPGKFDEDYKRALIEKIFALGGVQPAEGIAAKQSAPPQQAKSSEQRKSGKILAIGASTGGIHSMNVVLGGLERDFTAPILITQHLPSSFMAVFARQIAVASGRHTVVADHDIELAANTIYIAPGQAHLTVRRRGNRYVTALDYAPSRSGCTPSVDPMLHSLADATDGHATALILSGMGRDGIYGATHLFESGGTILAQDKESSAVWGMPRAVAEAGLAKIVATPERLAEEIALTMDASAWR